MSAREAIRLANALLPGEPVVDGLDPRWQAIIEIGEHIMTAPESVWKFVCRWGSHPQDDLRAAVATCVLEHLLQHHFDDFFPRVEQRALKDPLFAKTTLMCRKFGQSERPPSARRFERLQRRLSSRRS